MRRVDLTGKQFNNWSVIEYIGNRKYLCRCSCGNECEVLNYHLLSNASTKCRECSGLVPKQIEKGTKIGKYEILDNFIKNGHTYSICRCKCGAIRELSSAALRAGQTKGCKSCAAFKGYKEIPSGYYSQIKRRAKDCKFEFNISIEYIWDLFIQQNRLCAISGIELKFASSKDKCRLQTASLDRMDSSKGYIKGNVQWIHKIVNSMKNSLSTEEFLYICNIIAKQNPVDIIKYIELPDSIFIK